jgi:hypothetical protein
MSLHREEKEKNPLPDCAEEGFFQRKELGVSYINEPLLLSLRNGSSRINACGVRVHDRCHVPAQAHSKKTLNRMCLPVLLNQESHPPYRSQFLAFHRIYFFYFPYLPLFLLSFCLFFNQAVAPGIIPRSNARLRDSILPA